MSEIYENLLRESEQLFNNKNYSEAEKKYRDSLYVLETLKNKNAYIADKAYCLGQIGRCHLALNNFEGAISSFKNSIQIYPTLDYLYNLISTCNRYKKLDDVFNYSVMLIKLLYDKICIDDNNFYREEAIRFIKHLELNYNYKKAIEYFKTIKKY